MEKKVWKKPVYKYVNGILVESYDSIAKAGKCNSISPTMLGYRITSKYKVSEYQSKKHIYHSYSDKEEFSFVEDITKLRQLYSTSVETISDSAKEINDLKTDLNDYIRMNRNLIEENEKLKVSNTDLIFQVEALSYENTRLQTRGFWKRLFNKI